MRASVTTLFLLVILLPGVLPRSPARAEDYDETELRLKTAGLDEAIREEIHGAIRRGVAFLRRHQFRDGSFGSNAGWTSLAGLALRHAAIPKGVEGGRRAIRWLEGPGRAQAIALTYNAGLTAMLLKADDSGDSLQAALHAALAKGPLRGGNGYWDYASAGGMPVPNLSTAQFGCLGLWAGERAGTAVARPTWERHLETLLELQEEDGSWSYHRTPYASAGAWRGYPTGTFMGIANLLLSEEALAEELRENPGLLVRVRLARARAAAALRRHVHWTFAAPERRNALGYFHFYRLYAMEKACIFLGEEEVGGVRWYRVGARWLIDHQEKDGGWVSLTAPPAPQGNNVVVLRQPLETSFALLFLLRASESYRPITPRPVGGGAVITPRDGEGSPPSAPPAEPSALPLPLAERVLDDLAAMLESPEERDFPAILVGLDFVRRTWPQYRPDGTPRSEEHDAWCRRVEDLLVEAATGFVGSGAGRRAVRHAVACEALEFLGSTSPRVGPRLMACVRDVRADNTFPVGVRAAWFSAALDALQRLNPPGLLAFLRGSLVSPKAQDWPQTSAAITTLAGLPRLPGGARYATAKAVLTRLEPLQPRSSSDPSARDLLLDLCALLRTLAGPAADGDFPEVLGDDPVQDIKDVLRWFRRHDRPKARIWRD